MRGLRIAKDWGFIFARTFSRVVPGLPEGTNPRAFSPTTCHWFSRSSGPSAGAVRVLQR
jgi:hypothetical protein